MILAIGFLDRGQVARLTGHARQASGARSARLAIGRTPTARKAESLSQVCEGINRHSVSSAGNHSRCSFCRKHRSPNCRTSESRLRCNPRTPFLTAVKKTRRKLKQHDPPAPASKQSSSLVTSPNTQRKAVIQSRRLALPRWMRWTGSATAESALQSMSDQKPPARPKLFALDREGEDGQDAHLPYPRRLDCMAR